MLRSTFLFKPTLLHLFLVVKLRASSTTRSDERRRGYPTASIPSAPSWSDPLLLLEQDSPKLSSPCWLPSPLVTARNVVFFPSPESRAVRQSPIWGRSLAAELLQVAPSRHLLSYCSERLTPIFFLVEVLGPTHFALAFLFLHRTWAMCWPSSPELPPSSTPRRWGPLSLSQRAPVRCASPAGHGERTHASVSKKMRYCSLLFVYLFIHDF
jgi:hypothetical protein